MFLLSVLSSVCSITSTGTLGEGRNYYEKIFIHSKINHHFVLCKTFYLENQVVEVGKCFLKYKNCYVVNKNKMKSKNIIYPVVHPDILSLVR